MIQDQQVIAIGHFVRTHGTCGELQCQMDNSLWKDVQATFVILRLQHILTPFRVIDWRLKGNENILFTLAGIDNESAAQRLVGSEVYMLRRDVSSSCEDAITWQSLVGYQVIDIDQGVLGQITQVDESTINTLVTLDTGILIPLHEDFIEAIQEESHQITIRLPFQLQ